MRDSLVAGDTRHWPGPKAFALVLGVLLAAMFPGIVAGTRTFFLRDYGVLGYPFVHYAHEAFWRGELPLWNPLSNCGVPFLAQWGTMLLYPGTLLYLIFPLPWSLGVFCLLHLWWGGMGMYTLASRWTENRWAATLAGIAFVFNGATLSCLNWPNYMVALGWMPWVVHWMEQSWSGGRSVGWALAAATFQLLVGVPELVVLTWCVIGTLAVVQVAQGIVPLRTVAKRVLTVVLAASGLAAAQLLPFLELAARSQRGLDFATAKWAMPVWGWANLLAPLFHNVRTFQSQYFQHGQEFLSSYYLGAGCLVAAGAALWGARQARIWVLAGLTLWCLIMALGDPALLYTLLRKTIPAMGLARYPIKFVLLAAFTVPLLAAFAVARLDSASDWRKSPTGRGLLVLAPLALAAMAAIVWWGARHPLPFDQWPALRDNTILRGLYLVLFVAALVVAAAARVPQLKVAGRAAVLGLFLLDTLTHTSWQNPVLEASVMSPGVVRLEPAPRWGQSRVLISREAEQSLLQSRVPSFDTDFVGKRLALWSNLNLLENAAKVNGSSTLQVAEQAQVQRLFYETNAVPLPRLADFLGVSHETSSNSVVEWTRRAQWLPFLTAGQRPVFLAGTNTLEALTRPDFDPRRTVYLPLEAQGKVQAAGSPDARVVPTRLETHRLEAEVTASQPALVVVAQSHYPAWRATVDGQETVLWRANHAFQALEVPAGTHRVAIVYRDRTFWIGAAISALTLAVCGGAGLRAARLRNRRAQGRSRGGGAPSVSQERPMPSGE